ncbi:hypothetical protein [Leisingera daeponensis]|uniref:hypothetical protein n=1 Tax=Leisingera daeponensis TaxID=405746 RepID=UPI001C95C064|nr:hypothetical protein [Leisingera daeponensis]MBY6058619.1 hypothetical protein [Leisingera daeponensis]
MLVTIEQVDGLACWSSGKLRGGWGGKRWLIFLIEVFVGLYCALKNRIFLLKTK